MRNGAAYDLRRLEDPKGLEVAERYRASQGIQWQRGLYFAPLLYVLALLSVRREAAGKRGWPVGLHLAAAASMLGLVGLYWLPVGEGAEVYWLTVVFYPVGFILGASAVSRVLVRRGEAARAAAFRERAFMCVPWMWGVVAAWTAAGWRWTSP